MFNPDGCFCCEPPEDPCVLSGCTWSSTEMSDTDLTAGTAYNNQVSGSTPDGTYEITNVQLVGTGNDPPCRKITIETVEAPHKPDTVYAICWKDNATHNPATQCPLTSVSFCVESKRHDDSDATNTLTDAVVFVVRQNNRIYATASQSVGVNWKRASGSYVQNQFTEIDGAGNPNFTASGLPIEFGFALKLQVGEDEEPYDVVMFDNLCITRPACSGACDISACDYSYDGSSGVSVASLIDDGSGDVAVEFSTSSVEGIPPNSYELSFVANDPNNPSVVGNVYNLLELSGVSYPDPEECRSISQMSVCLNLKTVVHGGGVDFVWICILQDGDTYAASTGGFIPANGAFHKRTISLPSSSFRKVTGYGFTPTNSGGSPTMNLTTVAQFPDFSQSFELAVLVGSGMGQSHGVTHIVYPHEFYIDNICVKAVYGTCFDQEYSVATTGISVIEKTPSCGGTWGAVATEFSGILSGAVVLTRYTSGIPSGTCFYAYRYRSVVDPRYEIVVGMSSINNGTSEKWRLSYLFSGFTHTTLSMSLSQSLECDDIASFSGLSQYLYPSGWTALPSCIQFNPTSPAATVTPV